MPWSSPDYEPPIGARDVIGIIVVITVILAIILWVTHH